MFTLKMGTKWVQVPRTCTHFVNIQLFELYNWNVSPKDLHFQSFVNFQLRDSVRSDSTAILTSMFFVWNSKIIYDIENHHLDLEG